MKLHLGCGTKYLPGFTHIDIAEFSHIDHISNIDNLSFISDASVEQIYSSHAFEYFDRNQASGVLLEWNRVLRPGGCLYLTVPDIQALIAIYSETKNLNSIIGPLFGRWVNDENIIYHRTTWDFDSLSLTLENCGFSLVSKFNPIEYLNSIDPTYDDYSLAYFPHMDRDGIQVSLAIKAQK
jgi:predicted SAM-dependent methyltransferase